MKQQISVLLQKGIKCVENYITETRSSFHIGGVAAFAVFPTEPDQLRLTLELLTEADVPFEVIGKASNVLFAFDRYEGILIFTEGMNRLERQGDRLICQCGYSLTALAARAAEWGLSGLEFAYGIPGTVGGAVFMNAGAYGSEVSAVLCESLAYDLSAKSYVRLTDHGFGYRESVYMKRPLICVEATFALKQGEQEEIRAVMRENMEKRREKQPLSAPNAGSYFKRPAGFFAGKLIEDAGLKGASVGGAQVSEKHAGFLINRGGATAEDVLRLEELVRQRVWEQFHVLLEREVRVIRRVGAER